MVSRTPDFAYLQVWVPKRVILPLHLKIKLPYGHLGILMLQDVMLQDGQGY